jgi:hypothetical protein
MHWAKGAAHAVTATGAIGLMVLVGCSSSPAIQTGELGNGTFAYPCDSSTLSCDADNHAQPFPTAVASGAKFRVDFQRPGNKANIDTLLPISKQIIDIAPDGLFTANRTGWGGFVAKNPGGDLVDFSEVRIVKASEVWLNAHSDDGFTPDQNDFTTLTITLGGVSQSTFALRANLHSSTKELLSGEVDFEWKVSDPTIFSITNQKGHTATITGLKAGTATLTVSGAGVSKTANVEVK